MASIVADTAEVCEVHHYAMLVGYGASGVHPYGAYQTLAHFELSEKIESYRKACEKGIVKIMSRMGISTIAGYHGAQLFEAVGISEKVISEYFTGTVTRIGGLSLAQNAWIILIRVVVSNTKLTGNIICSIQKQSMDFKKLFVPAAMRFIKNMRRR